MLGLAEVRDWLKGFGIGENLYIGKLDNKKDKSLGVYQRKNDLPPRMTLGGWENAAYEVKPVSILLHWNKNARETEEASFDLYKKLQSITDTTINSLPIYKLILRNNEPIDVGADEKGVYERVIEFDLIYERKV